MSASHYGSSNQLSRVLTPSRIIVKTYLLILPVTLLVTYSQLIVKWRTKGEDQLHATTIFQHVLAYLGDPLVLSAYAAALFASFAWLYVITKLPLTVAFPIYIGSTFVLVMLGGWWFLSETLNSLKVIAILLIMAGIVLGINADA